MGGAFEHYGNITLSAEYNIYVDPESVQTVLELGIPNITFVPLDVTEQVILCYCLTTSIDRSKRCGTMTLFWNLS